MNKPIPYGATKPINEWKLLERRKPIDPLKKLIQMEANNAQS